MFAVSSVRQEGLEPPVICWKDNTAEHKQSRRLLEGTGGHSLTQAIEEWTKAGDLLDKQGRTGWECEACG